MEKKFHGTHHFPSLKKKHVSEVPSSYKGIGTVFSGAIPVGMHAVRETKKVCETVSPVYSSRITLRVQVSNY